MSFGENLQTIRKKKQLSQEGLAEMLVVSRQAISNYDEKLVVEFKSGLAIEVDG